MGRPSHTGWREASAPDSVARMKPVGTLLGLAANFSLGWGLYNLMGIGNCGGAYAPCPDDAWPYFVAVPLGIIVSVIAIFLGGLLAFPGVFAAVGIASVLRGLNGGIGGDGDTVFPFVFGGLFLLPSVLPLLLIPFSKRKQKKGERLKATGRRGVATVVQVSDTGVTVNNNPRVKLAWDVRLDDGTTLLKTKTMTVSRLDIPRVGDRHTVLIDPDDHDTWALGQEIKSAEPEPEPQAPTPAKIEQDWVNELGRLNDLRLQGALTDEEFARARDKLLAGDAAGGADQ